MSRCGVCDGRLNDYDFKSCKDTCGKCQFIIDCSLAEEDYFYDKTFTFEDEEEGVNTYVSLEYYDNLEYFDESEENT